MYCAIPATAFVGRPEQFWRCIFRITFSNDDYNCICQKILIFLKKGKVSSLLEMCARYSILNKLHLISSSMLVWVMKQSPAAIALMKHLRWTSASTSLIPIFFASLTRLPSSCPVVAVESGRGIDFPFKLSSENPHTSALCREPKGRLSLIQFQSLVFKSFDFSVVEKKTVSQEARVLF